MSPRNSLSPLSPLSPLLPLLVGACAFASGCTFEAPGSVLGTNSQGEDGSGNGGGNGGGGETGGGNGGGGGGGNGGGSGGGGTGGGAGADAGLPQATASSLTIAYTTQVNSGAYGTTNVAAAWVENSAGEYIATIDRKSLVRTRNLVAWVAKAPGGVQNADAVTGATLSNHDTPIEATWEIPGDLPEGTYTVRLESCDQNSTTPEQNFQGSFTFELNGTASLQADLVGEGFTGVKLDYSGTL